jgi:hypothetical protein
MFIKCPRNVQKVNVNPTSHPCNWREANHSA